MKNIIILILISSLVASLVITGYLGFRGPVEKDKIVYVQKKATSVGTLEQDLLALGVSDAWIETYGGNIKADCFQTELVNYRAVLRFCKLRKPLK